MNSVEQFGRSARGLVKRPAPNSSVPGYAVSLKREIFERVNRHNLPLFINDSQRIRGNQNHFGMLYRILMPIGSPQRKRPEASAGNPPLYPLHVHAEQYKGNRAASRNVEIHRLLAASDHRKNLLAA